MAKRAAINFHRVADWLPEAKEYQGIKLTKSIKEVYIAIWRICEAGRRKCKIAISTIMKKANVCRRTVFSAINALEKAKLIVVVRGGSERKLDLFEVKDYLEYAPKTEKATGAKIAPVKDKDLNVNTNSIFSTTNCNIKFKAERKIDTDNVGYFKELLDDESLDKSVTREVRKYFFVILNGKIKEYKVRTSSISAENVKVALRKLTKMQLKQLIERVMRDFQRGITITYKYSYYLSCFLSYALPTVFEIKNSGPEFLHDNEKCRINNICGVFGKFQQNDVDYVSAIARKFLN